MNNEFIYPFFISNEFIDFLKSIWIFPIFFYIFENCFKKPEQNKHDLPVPTRIWFILQG